MTKRKENNLRKNPWEIKVRKITRLMIQLRDWLVIRFGKENLEKNMKVGKKENRINKNIIKIK